MLQYCTDALVSSALRRARLPDSTFTAAEILAIANEELESFLVPLVVGAQEDFYETSVDVPLSASADATYRIPTRAVGSALRELYFLDSTGNYIDVPRIAVDDLERSWWGFVLQGQSIRYVNRAARAGPVTLRMIYSLTPNMLCQVASAAVISSIADNVLTLAAAGSPAWSLAPPPQTAPAVFQGYTSFDFVKASPSFEIVAFDQAGTFSATTMQLTLGSAVSGIEVGDYVALPHYSPVPQAPTVAWPLLAQDIAVAMLEQVKQYDQAASAVARLKRMQEDVEGVIDNRIAGAPMQMIPRHGIFNDTKRW